MCVCLARRFWFLMLIRRVGQTTLRTQGKKLTCVFCRADWIVPGGSGAGSGSARVGAGGYLNLSQVAGLSPQRDTSTCTYSRVLCYIGVDVPHQTTRVREGALGMAMTTRMKTSYLHRECICRFHVTGLFRIEKWFFSMFQTRSGRSSSLFNSSTTYTDSP